MDDLYRLALELVIERSSVTALIEIQVTKPRANCARKMVFPSLPEPSNKRPQLV